MPLSSIQLMQNPCIAFQSSHTPVAVGVRHGKPVVLKVNARKMQQLGFLFYLSANGVWLTDAVPPEYIAQDE